MKLKLKKNKLEKNKRKIIILKNSVMNKNPSPLVFFLLMIIPYKVNQNKLLSSISNKFNIK
jgi:hypothetical protein